MTSSQTSSPNEEPQGDDEALKVSLKGTTLPKGMSSQKRPGSLGSGGKYVMKE